MPRQRKPLTKIETSAIKAAEFDWLRWWSIERLPPKDMPREEVTKLKKAVKQMALAVDVLVNHQGSRQVSELISCMQEIQGFRHQQDHYQQMIDDLIEPLQLLGWACGRMGGRAPPPDVRARHWVCIAADAWLAAGLPQPTAKGRFFLALNESEVDHRVPGVTPDIAVSGLAHWRRCRAN